jgi:hypothetical protein
LKLILFVNPTVYSGFGFANTCPATVGWYNPVAGLIILCPSAFFGITPPKITP